MSIAEMPENHQLIRVVGAEDAVGPGPHAVSAGGLDLVLLHTQSGPRLFQGRCPHQGALLGEGELEDGTLVCRNHRWRFNVETGARQGGQQVGDGVFKRIKPQGNDRTSKDDCLVACPAVEQADGLFADIAPLRRQEQSTATAAQTPFRRPQDLPGPKGLPFLGSALEIDLDRLHQILEGWSAQYGSLYAFRLGRQRSVVVSDPALTAQILRSRPDTYRRVSKVQSVFKELGVDGVFSAEGAAWRAQRRLAMEALSQRHLRGFYPTLRMVADRLLKRWRTAAESGQPTDMVEDLKRFTVDVTTMLTFGHDLNTLEQTGDDTIQRRLELLFPAFNRRIFALWPYWRLVRLPRDRRVDEALSELRSWMAGLVREARVRLEADPARAARPSNFLEAMLSARDESSQPFSDETIFANLMTMLLAGEDTTAATLGWAIHEMCDSPASLIPLRAELDEALAGHHLPADIEVAARLSYTAAVANEAMRLRPVAPMIFFETLIDTTLADLRIPAGTPVATLARPPTQDPQRFDAPATFRPERWVAPPSAHGGVHDAASHIPFGSGPRICPGRSLALLEMKVVLAMLYKNFDVRRAGSREDVRELFAFTMAPSRLTVRLALR